MWHFFIVVVTLNLWFFISMILFLIIKHCTFRYKSSVLVKFGIKVSRNLSISGNFIVFSTLWVDHAHRWIFLLINWDWHLIVWFALLAIVMSARDFIRFMIILLASWVGILPPNDCPPWRGPPGHCCFYPLKIAAGWWGLGRTGQGETDGGGYGHWGGWWAVLVWGAYRPEGRSWIGSWTEASPLFGVRWSLTA